MCSSGHGGQGGRYSKLESCRQPRHLPGTGAWDVTKMRYSFESIINASNAGKTIVIHAFPGPAGANDQAQGGMFPTRGNTTTRNTFHVAAWAGPAKVGVS